MLKILLIDDEETICQGMKIKVWEVLKDQNHECLYELTARQGISVSNSWKPDIIVLDIRMPDMNGTEAISHIQKASPQSIILVVSAYADYKYVRSMFISGAMNYLLKPVSISDLTRAFRKAIQLRNVQK